MKKNHKTIAAALIFSLVFPLELAIFAGELISKAPKAEAAANVWENVGAAGFSPSYTVAPVLAFNHATETPYVAFIDTTDSFNEINVVEYDGSDWVDTGTIGFGPYTSPSLAFAVESSTGYPYVVFEDSENSNKITVKKYDGSSWITVGSAGFENGTVYSGSLAFNPQTHEPYLAFADNSSLVTVMKFNGSSWVAVGTAGINSSHTGNSSDISVAFNPITNEPYVGMNEDQGFSTIGKASVMKFNGSSWSYVGSAQFSNWGVFFSPLVFDPTTNEPYISFSLNQGRKAAVMKYSNSTWSIVGISGFSSSGINNSSITFNTLTGEPYIVYGDNEATVKKFNGSNWTTVGEANISEGQASIVLMAFNSTTNEPYICFRDDGLLMKLSVMKFNSNTVETPTVDVAEGTYDYLQSITLSTITSGASIYYTLDGSTPTASSTLYSGPITFSAGTLKAIGIKSGMVNSDVLTKTYSFKVGTPSADLAAGVFNQAQTVSLSTSTSGASIYYTLNGSTPTTSSTLYAGPITISSSQTIKAVGAKSGMVNSAVMTKTYSILGNEDGTPPEVSVVSITPSEVNTADSDQTVTVTVRIQDAGIGVCPSGTSDECSAYTSGGGYWHSSLSAGMAAVIGTQSVSAQGWQRISGTENDGTYTGTITLPRGSKQGVWKFSSIYVIDKLGNYDNLNSDDTSSFFIANTTSSDSVNIDKAWTLNGSNATAVFSEGTVVTKKDGGSYQFSEMFNQGISVEDLSTYTTITNIDEFGYTTTTVIPNLLGAFRLGVPGLNLSFSKPVAISWNVGSQYNGYTLNINSLSEGASSWANESTCVVSSSTCSFTVNHATYFSLAMQNQGKIKLKIGSVPKKTKKSTIKISGTTAPNAVVNISVGGQLKNTLVASGKGKFNKAISISKGSNSISISASSGANIKTINKTITKK